jgi:hypothetical protein
VLPLKPSSISYKHTKSHIGVLGLVGFLFLGLLLFPYETHKTHKNTQGVFVCFCVFPSCFPTKHPKHPKTPKGFCVLLGVSEGPVPPSQKPKA